jgi:serine/threonine protein kinase
MPLSAGTCLGPDEITAAIGAGGMGEVYKARDPRLHRTVAIKVSQEKFSERFEREARAVAALNHPHICTVYDVGPDYLVMEYIEGAPLKAPLIRSATSRLLKAVSEIPRRDADLELQILLEFTSGSESASARRDVATFPFGLWSKF